MTECHPRIRRMTEKMLDRVRVDAARKALLDAADSLEAVPPEHRGAVCLLLLRGLAKPGPDAPPEEVSA